MKTTSFLTLACSLMLALAQGQNEPNSLSALKITDGYLVGGFTFSKLPTATLQDFRRMAPGSALLNNDLSDYERHIYDWNTGHSQIDLMLGLRRLTRKEQPDGKHTYNTGPEWRIGLSYSSQNFLSAYYAQKESHPYDTLTSAQTGEEFYTDSVYYSSYNMNSYAEQLQLRSSLIWRLRPDSRWDFYAGVGLSAGVSLNSYSDIYYSESSYESEDNEHRSFEGNRNTQGFESERWRQPAVWQFSSYLPLGIDWQMGKNNKLLDHFHLFYEMRPGLEYYHLPGYGSYVHAAMFQGIGLRFLAPSLLYF